MNEEINISCNTGKDYTIWLIAIILLILLCDCFFLVLLIRISKQILYIKKNTSVIKRTTSNKIIVTDENGMSSIPIRNHSKPITRKNSWRRSVDMTLEVLQDVKEENYQDVNMMNMDMNNDGPYYTPDAPFHYNNNSQSSHQSNGSHQLENNEDPNHLGQSKSSKISRKGSRVTRKNGQNENHHEEILPNRLRTKSMN